MKLVHCYGTVKGVVAGERPFRLYRYGDDDPVATIEPESSTGDYHYVEFDVPEDGWWVLKDDDENSVMVIYRHDLPVDELAELAYSEIVPNEDEYVSFIKNPRFWYEIDQVPENPEDMGGWANDTREKANHNARSLIARVAAWVFAVIARREINS